MKTLKQIREASGGKEAYQKFFNSLLKKFGVDSPSELTGDKKKKFFNAVDKGWEGDDPNDANEVTIHLPNKLTEKLKGGKGKATIDANWDGDKKDAANAKKLYKVNIKITRHGADISGKKADILKYLKGADYGMDDADIEDLYPELMENKDDFKDDTDVSDDEGNYSGVDEVHKTLKQIKKNKGSDGQDLDPDTEIDEKAPPGMEDVVLKLKADGKTDEEAFAIAWSIYNKKEGKKWGPAKKGKSIKGAKFGKSHPVMDQGQRTKIIKIAKANSGNMAKAIKLIDKIRKGLSDNPAVMDILKKANESLDLQRTGDTGSSKSVKEAKGDQPGQAEYYKKVDKVNAKYGIGPHGKSLSDLSSSDVKKYFKDYDKAVKENVSEATIHITNELSEKLKAGKGKETIGTDVDWDNVGDEKKWIKQAKSKYKVTIKKDVGKYHSGASISGKKADIIKFLQGPMYGGVDDRDIEDMFPFLLEGVSVDRRTLGFKAAMIRSEKAKKVREKSKLKKEKKKEQAVLDARYEYDGEVDTVLANANKALFGETGANAVAHGGVDMAPNAGKKEKKSKVIKRYNY